MREYVLLQLKVKPMRDLLFRSRIFTYLAAATPGLKELVTIGKIWELALDAPQGPQTGARYDLVIVDAPATGHGVGFLQTPRTFAEHRPGRADPPAGRDARSFVRDPERTGVAVVALPEEMPVNETVALERDLAEEVGVGVDRIYCNGLYPERFDDAEAERIEAVDARAPTTAARAACRAALTESRRAGAQREQLARLEEICDGAGDARSRICSSPSSGVEQIDALADGAVGLMAGIAELLEGKRICVCAGSGGVGKTTTRGGDRRRDGRAGQAGRGADDRPGEAARRLARTARARQRRAPGRPGAVRRRRDRDRGRRAVGDDARREADLRRGRPRARPRRRDPRPDPLQPHLPAALRARSPARRSTWRWRSSSSSTPRTATTCWSSTRRRPATRSTSSRRPNRLMQFIEGRALQVFMQPTGLRDAGLRARAPR